MSRSYFTIRIDDDLRERLNREASAQYRSASNLAELAIAKYFEQLDASRGDPSPGHSVKVKP